VEVWKTGDAQTVFLWGDLRERDYLEDLSVDGRKVLNCIFKNRNGAGLD